jgi:hypothetical protein
MHPWAAKNRYYNVKAFTNLTFLVAVLGTFANAASQEQYGFLIFPCFSFGRRNALGATKNRIFECCRVPTFSIYGVLVVKQHIIRSTTPKTTVG